jgi:hypothetical protein
MGKLKNSKGKKPVPVPLCHKSYMHWPGLEPRHHSKQPVSGTATVIINLKGYRNQYAPIFRYHLSE